MLPEPDEIMVLLGTEWQKDHVGIKRHPLTGLITGGTRIRQVRTAAGGTDIEVFYPSVGWRSAVWTDNAFEHDAGIAYAVGALYEQIKTVFRLKIKMCALKKTESVFGRVFLLEIETTAPRQPTKYWHPSTSIHYEWHRAVTSDCVPVELHRRELMLRAAKRWRAPILLRKRAHAIVREWTIQADPRRRREAHLARTYAQKWAAEARRKRALAMKYAKRWVSRTTFAPRPEAPIPIGGWRKKLRLIEYALQVQRAEHPDVRTCQSFLPFRTLALQSLPNADPDPNEWTIIWVFGFEGHAHRFVATELAPFGLLQAKAEPGVRYLDIPTARSTIIVVAERGEDKGPLQPTTSFEGNEGRYVASVIPLVRRAFNSRRVKLVVGGSGDIAAATILTRSFLFCAAGSASDNGTWEISTNLTIMANPRVTPAAEMTARALGCRFEGRVDPVCDDTG